MLKTATEKLINKEPLSQKEARLAMEQIMQGSASPVQISSYLSALAVSGETIDEITGSAQQMRKHGIKIDHNFDDLFEIVGTGGDKSNSFNISTTASIVIASSGVKVAKHGNRAASSNSGSADCLEALGVNINIPKERCLELLEEIGICFIFAQNYHPSMKNVAPVRKELGIRTIFNLLGPLTNPASANIQLLGVYSKDLVQPLAEVLMKLEVKKGMVVFGEDNMDEISISAPTFVCEFQNNTLKTYTMNPEEFGLKTYEKADIKGGQPIKNAMITRKVLDKEKGAYRDIVILNAAAGLYLTGKAKNIKEGVNMASYLIDSGKAKKKLEEFVIASQV